MKMKKRIGIYHYQYYRGACKLCYRHFIQEMVESYEKCHEVAEEIYGKENCEFLHYSDNMIQRIQTDQAFAVLWKLSRKKNWM